MPSSARSCAAVFAHAHSPVRAMLDSVRSRTGWRTVTEAMKQTRPHRFARMCGTAARASRTEASMLALTAPRI
jgi:hypothetical protein